MKNVLKTMFLLTLIFAINGCKKDQLFDNNNKLNVLQLNSIQEADSLLDEILTMSNKELIEWQTQNNFKSLGVKSRILYETLHPENYSSKSSLVQSIKSNSEFLRLVKNNGETQLEPIYFGIPYRFFSNYNGIFQIKDRYYKILENGMLSSDLENLNLLKSINQLSDINENSKIKLVYRTHYNPAEKRCLGCNDCPADKTTYPENGNNRVKVEVGLGLTITYPPNAGTLYRWTMLAEIRPQHRILGIWFFATRHIDYDIKLALDYYVWYEGHPQETGWERITNEISGTHFGTVVKSKLEKSNLEYPGNIYHITAVKMSGYDIMGDTADVSPVNLECHKEVF